MKINFHKISTDIFRNKLQERLTKLGPRVKSVAAPSLPYFRDSTPARDKNLIW